MSVDDDTSLNGGWQETANEIASRFEQEAVALRERIEVCESEVVRLRAELGSAKEELAKSYEDLDSREATPLKAYCSIAVGALGFLGACYATAWTLRSLLPPEIAQKGDVLAQGARAVQAALTSLHLREVVFCLGIAGLAALAIRHLKPGRTPSTPMRRDFVMAVAATFFILIPFYQFEENSPISIFEGAFVASALVSPLFGLVKISRLRAFLERSLEVRYAFPVILILALLGAVSVALHYYPVLLTVVLLGSVFFYEMIVSGAELNRTLQRHAELVTRVQRTEASIKTFEEERDRCRKELYEVPRRKRREFLEAEEAWLRKLREQEREKRWRNLIDGKRRES